MPIFIEMPQLSDTMTEGTLVKWLKKEGDTVNEGDEIAEVETDKATMSMEAFDDGVLHKILIPEGGKVAIGGQLAVLLEEDEDPPSEAELASLGSSAAPASAATEAAEATTTTAEAPAAVAVTSNGGRIKASPLAKKIAASRGVNLAAIQGSGPGGRIVRKDVEAAPAGGSAIAPAAAVGAAAAVAGAGAAVAAITPGPMSGTDTKIPLSGMRSVIADRLLASKTQIPHFYLNVELDAGPLVELRKQVNASSEKTGGNKYTFNDFILKAIIAAAVEVPQVNASFTPDGIIQYGSVHLCVAIAVEDGLVTPVIRDAQNCSLLDISTGVKDLAERARAKKLTPDEFQGGTMTVSNLGAYGIDSFDAIINPPQAAILSIGAIKAKPVVNGSGDIVAGQRMWIGLSGDHRVVDGAVGATYLQALVRMVENPALMLV